MSYFSSSGAEQRLLLISEKKSVGFLPGGHEVFKINKVVCVTLALDSEQEIDITVSRKIIMTT